MALNQIERIFLQWYREQPIRGKISVIARLVFGRRFALRPLAKRFVDSCLDFLR
jgi:hypothetical protein